MTTTLRVGDLAYLDTLRSGFVPCKVVAIGDGFLTGHCPRDR